MVKIAVQHVGKQCLLSLHPICYKGQRTTILMCMSDQNDNGLHVSRQDDCCMHEQPASLDATSTNSAKVLQGCRV